MFIFTKIISCCTTRFATAYSSNWVKVGQVSRRNFWSDNLWEEINAKIDVGVGFQIATSE